MKKKFAILVGTTLINLIGKGITVETLRATLKKRNRRHGDKITEELIGLTDINDAFMVFSKFWSFFDYNILSLVIESLCSDLKPRLNEYTSSLREYCKRRVCEVPAADGEEQISHFQVDETFASEITRVKFENLKVLGSILGKLLGTNLLIIELIGPHTIPSPTTPSPTTPSPTTPPTTPSPTTPDPTTPDPTTPSPTTNTSSPTTRSQGIYVSTYMCFNYGSN